MTDIKQIAAKNRAEEFGPDVWRYFVIPPYFDKIDLSTAKKPRVVIGGRGCGKTMLLRYFSHDTIFSEFRNVFDPCVPAIGLYWRVDQQFCYLMHGRGKGDSYWVQTFQHYLALMVARELLASLQNYKLKSAQTLGRETTVNPTFKDLFNADGHRLSLEAFAALLSEAIWKLEVSLVNSPGDDSGHILPARSFLFRVIDDVRTSVPSLSQTVFHVYVDEYENLRTNQKRVINSFLKFSEVPLVFHVAMKRNSFDERRTLGDETLSDVHDYRELDLEKMLSMSDFQTFSAEIFLHSFSDAGVCDYVPDAGILHDESRLYDRSRKDYKDRVLKSVQAVLPPISHKQVAAELMSDPALKRKVEQRVRECLNTSASYTAADFIPNEFPEAGIVNAFLLARQSVTATALKRAQDAYLSKDGSRDAKRYEQWIHNNLVGAILVFYSIYKKDCPLYSGYKTFGFMANGNIRHFLELCGRAIVSGNEEYTKNGTTPDSISVYRQAKAARQASRVLVDEIRNFGPMGEPMRVFVLRLGRLLKLASDRPTLSEPEITQFCIASGTDSLSADDHRLISEAVKYSVLAEFEDTKSKSLAAPSLTDYALNPIYAPYFYLSYRRMRKLDLTLEDFRTLYGGGIDSYRELLNRRAIMLGYRTPPRTNDLFSNNE